jgi:hypothetical protein
VPTFGEVNLGGIRQEDVRTWRATQLRTGPQQDRPFGPVTVAKAYRLLRDPQHRGTGQADQREPVPDQGRRPGIEPRTPGAQRA